MAKKKPKVWLYVISPRGKSAWVDDGGSSPLWVGDTGWHGAVEARTITEAREKVERLRAMKAAQYV